MLERAFYQKLLNWKRSNERKALLVDGARQIGKTTLIEEFSRREYADSIKIDFIEDSTAAAYLGEAASAKDLIERLTLLVGKPVEPGRTLVFFDEVQEAPRIVTLVKYLVQDGRFPVVMSGSMLGVELHNVPSFPVGFLRIEHMFPLTFNEFCRAQNVPEAVMNSIGNAFRNREPLEATLHDRLIRLFRLYLVVGGMPEAVQRYLDTRYDLGAVRTTQTDLVALYRQDIAKYAGNRALQVKAIFDELPAQLAKENKRFQLKSLRDKARFERFANDFAWLVSAKAALKTVNVTEPKFMLKRTEEEARFKLYASDTGMLMSEYPTEVAMAALAGARDVNYGSVYENAVAQALAAAGSPLRYYHNNRKGEIDFLIETDQAKVVPVEVKSGKDYKLHTALNNLLGTPDFGIEYAYVLSEANVSTRERAGKPVHYLPMYMMDCVAKEASTRGPAEVPLMIAPPSFA